MKPGKKPYSIDETHCNLLKQFQENDEVLVPKLKREIETLRRKSQQLQLSQIDTYLDIQDKIEQKKETIKQLRNKGKKYLLENSAYIFDYFEKKKDISVGGGKQNENILNTFFKIRATNETAANLDSDKYNPSKLSYNNYWKNVENEIINFADYVVPFDRCHACAKGELIPQDEEGIMICNNESCGKFIPYIVDSSKPTNKEPPNEVSYTAYIRLNHFKEILSQFQAKETTQIPEEIIDNIRARIKKERIQQSELDYDKMREILRKLGYNKYFEHIQYINSLLGIKPPVMSEELHDTLCVLFIEIQKPWATHCPANRTNFFNYAYTLYQLCTLLDQVQYLPFIPMMKDREKQLEQDMIWKKVCNDLDWQFFPTV
jgi:hypothetical protein